jgi:hypothetical protein
VSDAYYIVPGLVSGIVWNCCASHRKVEDLQDVEALIIGYRIVG